MRLKHIAVAALVLAPFASAHAQDGAAAVPAAGAADATAAPAPPPAPKLDGKFRFVGGEKESKQVEEAIEQVVQEMLFLKRPIARGRLKDRNRIATAWIIGVAGGQIKANAEGIMAWSSPENGSPADVKTSTGDDAKLTQKITDNKLVQIFKTKEGVREDIFTMSADGQTLTLVVTVTSEQLPIPLKYTLTYKK